MDSAIKPDKVPHASSSLLLRLLEEQEEELGLKDAVLHYEFPIYRGLEGETVTVKALLMSPRHGVVVIGTTDTTPKTVSGDLEKVNKQVEDAFSAIFARAIRNKALRKNIRELLFPLEAVIYAPFLEGAQVPDGLASRVLQAERDVREFLHGLDGAGLTPEIFDEVVASIEGSKGLVRPKKRDLADQPPDSKGRQAEKAELEICRFDRRQKAGYVPILDGPQRVRGLAGSGKTVVLAMKAALTHLRDPEASIVYTFYTKSLYQHIRRLITRFYRQFDDRDPDWSRLRIMHGWGGESTPGVYYEATKAFDRPFMSYSDAVMMERKNPFDYACGEFLKAAPGKPLWDYVFVDEGQDFPASFIRLCHSMAKNGRVMFAYDDLQTIFQSQAPTPGEIFGTDADGKPKVDLTSDEVLYKCYRNPREVLVCAHALGFGLYSDHIVQMLENKEHWEDIGYRVKEGVFRNGEKVVIERPVENSLKAISDESGINEIVQATFFGSQAEEVTTVAASIQKDLATGLRPDDVLVVTVDDRYAKSYLQLIALELTRLGIASHNIHSDVFGLTDFQQDAHVTLSTVHKAKGNEAFMVYIVGVDATFRPAEVRSRNIIFTAMTRAKGWVRLSGIGVSAKRCADEIDEAKKHFPNLVFVYPGPERLKVMKRDLEERAAKRQAAERHIDEVLEDMTPEEILEYLRRKKHLDEGEAPGSKRKRRS
jgi:superfamily I DNA and RNA helicase